MKKKSALLVFLLGSALLLCACGTLSPTAEAAAYDKYSATYLDTFDTVITLTGYAQSKAEFDAAASLLHARYVSLHRLYDNYNTYDGVENLCTLNQRAAQEPVTVDAPLFNLLALCKAQQPLLHGQVNVAMGSVLDIWHTYREAGLNDPERAQLPDRDALIQASAHTNFDDVILDEEHQTVFFTDPALKLDLGAVAKGYATELVAQELIASGFTSFVISAGGNVRAGSAPMDGRSGWGVGIQNPALDKANDLVDVLYLTDLSVVTSGNYQRYYTVDGVMYHHLIDPDTLMPSTHFPSVTIVTEDSGIADLLSTAVFLMPYEEGRAFVDSLNGVEALWIFDDGATAMTDGMKAYAQSQGASAR